MSTSSMVLISCHMRHNDSAMRRAWMKPFLLVIVAAFTATACAPERSMAQDADRVAVGIMCEGSVLHPVVMRSQQKWTSLTEDDEPRQLGDPLKITGAAKALPREGWTLFPSGGGAPRVLKVGGAVGGPPCFNEGFKIEGATQPQGVAVLGEATVDPVEDVRRLPDASSRRIGNVIIQLTNSFEAERAETAETYVPGPGGERREYLPSASQRARGKVNIDRLWRHHFNDADWYYFEARKSYSDPGREVGDTVAQGWIRAAASGGYTSLFDVSVILGNVDDKGLLKLDEVHGVVRLGDRAFWVVTVLGYESGFFQLKEIGPYGEAPKDIPPGRLPL
jgi:hypothetical protein